MLEILDHFQGMPVKAPRVSIGNLTDLLTPIAIDKQSAPPPDYKKEKLESELKNVPGPKKICRYRVACDVLNLRSDHSASSERLAAMPYGTFVELNDQSNDWHVENLEGEIPVLWVCVKYNESGYRKDSQIGWCSAEFLDVDQAELNDPLRLVMVAFEDRQQDHIKSDPNLGVNGRSRTASMPNSSMRFSDTAPSADSHSIEGENYTTFTRSSDSTPNFHSTVWTPLPTVANASRQQFPPWYYSHPYNIVKAPELCGSIHFNLRIPIGHQTYSRYSRSVYWRH